MNAGKIAAGGVVATLGGYISGLQFQMGLLGAGVVILVFATAIFGWEEYQNRK